MASSVSHGNIVQVHEMGREGDLDFIVMEHIEGQTLARLLHGRPMPAEKIADWGLQVAQGLSRAHQKGLLHRDLKPANILVTPEGEAKIVDFGLAALFSPKASTFTATKPLEGEDPERRIAGTLPYMSPEQVRGERLDSRSDIFSFGTILYEMATGQRPFAGSTTADLALQIQECRPRPVHDLVPKVPVELHRIIEKAMARRPEDRYQGMGDMAVDLKRLARELESGSSPSYEELERLLRPGRRRWLRRGLWAAASLAVAVAAVLGVPRILHRGAEKAPGPDLSVLAVLPFEDLGGPGGNAEQGFWLSEGITTQLSGVNGLTIVSPATARPEAGQTLDPRRIGEELEVGSILAGSVQREGQGIRVSVHLIAVAQGSNVWTRQFQVTADGMSAVQDSIVAGVTEALGIVSPSEVAMPVTRRWMENQRAYAYFLAGMEQYLAGRSLHPVADARYWFERALGLDPQYAPALAMEGELAAREDDMDAVLRPGAMEKAYERVNRALELDPALPIALLAQARVLAEDGRWDEAIASGEQALRANPNLGYSYRILGVLYEGAEQYDKAIQTVTLGIQVDDTRPRAYVLLGRLYRETWNFPQAERMFRAGLERFPDDPLLMRSLADFLEDQDRGQEALEMRREGLARDPDDYSWYVDLMNQLRNMDRGAEADSMAGLLREKWPNEPRALDWAGWHLMNRGDRETARKLFERALQLEPLYLPARNNLGWCLEQEDRFDDAEEVYKKGIELVPDNFLPTLRLAMFYERRGQLDKAEKMLVQGSKQRPDKWGRMIQVARFYNRTNRHDLAETWARKAREAAPSAAAPYNQLAWELWHQEKFEAARDAFLEAIRRSPDWYDNYRGLARTLNSLSRPDSAETVMETWVRQRPGHAPGWFFLGWVRQQAGKMNQAAAAYEKALELRPRNVGELNNLAIFYGQIGRHEKQQEMFRRATEIDSTNGLPWMNLASNYNTMGDDERAWAAAKKAVPLVEDSDYFAASNYTVLAQIEHRRGREQESEGYLARAQDRISHALHDHPLDPEVLAEAAYIYGYAGDLEKVHQYAEEAAHRQSGSPDVMYELACGLAMAGDREGAFEYLDRAVAAGYADRWILKQDPDLDGIRDDPRFAEVLGMIQ